MFINREIELKKNKKNFKIQKPKEIYNSSLKPVWDQYLGVRFESFCKHAMIRLLTNKGINIKKAGSYWRTKTKTSSGVQIDLVIEREDGEIHICECKWRDKPVGIEVYNQLLYKISEYPHKTKTINPTIISLTKPAKTLVPLIEERKLWFFTLKDLYDVNEP